MSIIGMRQSLDETRRQNDLSYAQVNAQNEVENAQNRAEVINNAAQGISSYIQNKVSVDAEKDSQDDALLRQQVFARVESGEIDIQDAERVYLEGRNARREQMLEGKSVFYKGVFNNQYKDSLDNDGLYKFDSEMINRVSQYNADMATARIEEALKKFSETGEVDTTTPLMVMKPNISPSGMTIEDVAYTIDSVYGARYSEADGKIRNYIDEGMSENDAFSRVIGELCAEGKTFTETSYQEFQMHSEFNNLLNYTYSVYESVYGSNKAAQLVNQNKESWALAVMQNDAISNAKEMISDAGSSIEDIRRSVLIMPNSEGKYINPYTGSQINETDAMSLNQKALSYADQLIEVDRQQNYVDIVTSDSFVKSYEEGLFKTQTITLEGNETGCIGIDDFFAEMGIPKRYLGNDNELYVKMKEYAKVNSDLQECKAYMSGEKELTKDASDRLGLYYDDITGGWSGAQKYISSQNTLENMYRQNNANRMAKEWDEYNNSRVDFKAMVSDFLENPPMKDGEIDYNSIDFGKYEYGKLVKSYMDTGRTYPEAVADADNYLDTSAIRVSEMSPNISWGKDYYSTQKSIEIKTSDTARALAEGKEDDEYISSINEMIKSFSDDESKVYGVFNGDYPESSELETLQLLYEEGNVYLKRLMEMNNADTVEALYGKMVNMSTMDMENMMNAIHDGFVSGIPEETASGKKIEYELKSNDWKGLWGERYIAKATDEQITSIQQSLIETYEGLKYEGQLIGIMRTTDLTSRNIPDSSLNPVENAVYDRMLEFNPSKATTEGENDLSKYEKVVFSAIDYFNSLSPEEQMETSVERILDDWEYMAKQDVVEDYHSRCIQYNNEADGFSYEGYQKPDKVDSYSQIGLGEKMQETAAEMYIADNGIIRTKYEIPGIFDGYVNMLMDSIGDGVNRATVETAIRLDGDLTKDQVDKLMKMSNSEALALGMEQNGVNKSSVTILNAIDNSFKEAGFGEDTNSTIARVYKDQLAMFIADNLPMIEADSNQLKELCSQFSNMFSYTVGKKNADFYKTSGSKEVFDASKVYEDGKWDGNFVQKLTTDPQWLSVENTMLGFGDMANEIIGVNGFFDPTINSYIESWGDKGFDKAGAVTSMVMGFLGYPHIDSGEKLADFLGSSSDPEFFVNILQNVSPLLCSELDEYTQLRAISDEYGVNLSDVSYDGLGNIKVNGTDVTFRRGNNGLTMFIGTENIGIDPFKYFTSEAIDSENSSITNEIKTALEGEQYSNIFNIMNADDATKIVACAIMENLASSPTLTKRKKVYASLGSEYDMNIGAKCTMSIVDNEKRYGEPSDFGFGVSIIINDSGEFSLNAINGNSFNSTYTVNLGGETSYSSSGKLKQGTRRVPTDAELITSAVGERKDTVSIVSFIVGAFKTVSNFFIGLGQIGKDEQQARYALNEFVDQRANAYKEARK